MFIYANLMCIEIILDILILFYTPKAKLFKPNYLNKSICLNYQKNIENIQYFFNDSNYNNITENFTETLSKKLQLSLRINLTSLSFTIILLFCALLAVFIGIRRSYKQNIYSFKNNFINCHPVASIFRIYLIFINWAMNLAIYVKIKNIRKNLDKINLTDDIFRGIIIVIVLFTIYLIYFIVFIIIVSNYYDFRSIDDDIDYLKKKIRELENENNDLKKKIKEKPNEIDVYSDREVINKVVVTNPDNKDKDNIVLLKNNQLKEKQIKELKSNNKKLLEENQQKNNEIKELRNEKSNLLKENQQKDNEIKELRNKNRDLLEENRQKEKELKELTSNNPYILKKNEKLLSIIFFSLDQKIHHSFICKNTDLFIHLEKSLYEVYDNLKNDENYFLLGGNKINRFVTIEENKIKNGDIIFVYQNGF